MGFITSCISHHHHRHLLRLRSDETRWSDHETCSRSSLSHLWYLECGGGGGTQHISQATWDCTVHVHTFGNHTANEKKFMYIGLSLPADMDDTFHHRPVHLVRLHKMHNSKPGFACVVAHRTNVICIAPCSAAGVSGPLGSAVRHYCSVLVAVWGTGSFVEPCLPDESSRTHTMPTTVASMHLCNSAGHQPRHAIALHHHASAPSLGDLIWFDSSDICSAPARLKCRLFITEQCAVYRSCVLFLRNLSKYRFTISNRNNFVYSSHGGLPHQRKRKRLRWEIWSENP